MLVPTFAARHVFSAEPMVLSASTSGSSLSCGCGCAKPLKSWDGMPWDGVGDGKPDIGLTPVLITVDTPNNDAASATALTVDGAEITSTIDTIGDRDFFSVVMEEGQTYDITLAMVTGGPSGIPLADAYLEIYDSAGNLISNADGGGGGAVDGLDAKLTFTATADGTYYIVARAFDQDGTNGSDGDFVGDYRIFAASVDETDPTVYVPFYSPDSPLHSIDWGSEFTRTTRNPDGDSGTRGDNGVPEGQTPIENNEFGITGKNVITYYYAETGDVFVSEDPTQPGVTENIVAQGMKDWEMAAFETMFDIYEQSMDIVYVRVYDRSDADIKIITYEGTPGVGASLLGRMSPPGEQNAGQMEINTGDVRWTEEGVQQGGFYFPTLLHELGHGHGLAHPHDNGGRSSIMPGADGGTGGIGGGYGLFGLSQQVYTVMSYNDGWTEGSDPGFAPEGHGGPRSGGMTGTEVDHFGWMGTLGALDIAVLQDKYGVNEEYRIGNDTYTIGDVNQKGAFYSCIWDAGGTDTMRYVGERDTYIDLRAATLKYEEGGAGRVSFAFGAWTGFTIANGVTIENATGGAGADLIIGNDANNRIDGGAGVDRLEGGLGDDRYYVDSSRDQVIEARNAGTDQVFSTVDFSLAGQYIERLTLLGTARAGTGNSLDNIMAGNDSNNVLNGGGGADRMAGGLGNDRYYVDTRGDLVVEQANAGSDTIVGKITIDLAGLVNVENVELIGTDDLLLRGNGSNNILMGNAGDNVINGLAGGDRLTGGAGADRFVWDSTSHSTASLSDRITDLGDDDVIDLSRLDANTKVAGDQAFVMVDAFSKAAGQVMLAYASGMTTLMADTNGDGKADLVVRLDGDHRDFDNFVF